MDNRTEVFNELRALLKHYQPPFVSRMDDDAHFDLWSIKDVVFAGRKRKEVYFAGLIIQKSYVGFYYMPIYAESELKSVFKPELLRLLKGKSCFHVKKLDPTLREQIAEALRIGFEGYQHKGWV